MTLESLQNHATRSAIEKLIALDFTVEEIAALFGQDPLLIDARRASATRTEFQAALGVGLAERRRAEMV